LSRTSFLVSRQKIHFFLFDFFLVSIGKPYDFQEIFIDFSAMGFAWELGVNTYK